MALTTDSHIRTARLRSKPYKLPSGYIESLEQALASMGECVNQVLDENERLLHANGEIAAAAEVMEELARGLVKS